MVEPWFRVDTWAVARTEGRRRRRRMSGEISPSTDIVEYEDVFGGRRGGFLKNGFLVTGAFLLGTYYGKRWV